MGTWRCFSKDPALATRVLIGEAGATVLPSNPVRYVLELEKNGYIDSKARFEDVSRSLRRSRVRSEILMYLYNNYPGASYPAEISRNIGIDPKIVLGGLKGTGWFDAAKSLLKQGVVEEIEREKVAYYRLSECGKSLIEGI